MDRVRATVKAIRTKTELLAETRVNAAGVEAKARAEADKVCHAGLSCGGHPRSVHSWWMRCLPHTAGCTAHGTH